jgi:cell division protein FtsB
MNASDWRCGIVIATVLSFVMGAPAIARGADDADTFHRLEQVIRQQQTQIEAQAAAIEQLRQQVQQLLNRTQPPVANRDAILEEATSTTGTGAAPLPESQAEAGAAQQAASEEKTAREKIVEEATETTRAEAEPLNERTGVRTGTGNVSVQLYGQVNKAVLFADDGNDDNWYVVDNDNSSTRVGLRAAARPRQGMEAGTRMEVEFQTNPSNEVSQIDKNDVGDNNFKKRWFDVYLSSERFGEVRLGHGSTASDGTSEVDLSGTAVIGYSSVSDLAGGQFFFNESTGSLTTTRVGNVFSNMDGLGRDDRIYYQTPEFYGLSAATSWVSGGAADVSVGYAAKWGPFAVGAAMAYGGYGSDSPGIDNQVNGSASALHDSGLNFTLAAGTRNFHSAARDDATFYYGKLGYRRDFFRFGETALAVDLERSYDLARNADEAESVGLMGVQDFTEWGTEYFFGYRNYRLDRPGMDLNDIDAVMTGVRVKF